MSSVRASQALLRGTSSSWCFEDSLTMAYSRFHLSCQHTSAKVVLIENLWIGTLKKLFIVGTLLYIWWVRCSVPLRTPWADLTLHPSLLCPSTALLFSQPGLWGPRLLSHSFSSTFPDSSAFLSPLSTHPTKPGWNPSCPVRSRDQWFCPLQNAENSSFLETKGHRD